MSLFEFMFVVVEKVSLPTIGSGIALFPDETDEAGDGICFHLHAPVSVFVSKG